MKTRALALGIGLILISTGCTQTQNGASSTVTSTTAANATTSPSSSSTTPTTSSLPAVDPTWMCYYLSNVVAIQAPPEQVAEATEVAIGMLRPLDSEVSITSAAAVLGEADAPPDRGEISNSIGQVLGLASTATLDPVEASIYLESQGFEDLGFGASPVHAVGQAVHWHFSPGTDPVSMPTTTLPPVGGGNGAFVAVVDSGFLPSGPTWLDDPYVVYEPYDIELDPNVVSHGTFVAGLIRRLSPENRVSIARVPVVAPESFTTLGENDPLAVSLSSELHVFEAVERLMSRHQEGQDVEALNMSLGTYSCDPAQDALLATLTTALQQWDSVMTGSQTFAAGGNEPYTGPFWPGALPNVRAVGAAGQSGEQVVWDVDGNEMTAQSRTWINDVAAGSYLIGFGGGPGNGIVAWSGSSFATAVAAALFARNETATPVSGIDWWLQKPVAYDAISGLSYTRNPLTDPGKTVP